MPEQCARMFLYMRIERADYVNVGERMIMIIMTKNIRLGKEVE